MNIKEIFKNLKTHFPSHRAFVDPIGNSMVSLVKNAPIIVLNSEDVEQQYFYKLLSVSTDEEFTNLKEREYTEEAWNEFKKKDEDADSIENRLYSFICKKIQEDFSVGVDFNILNVTRKKLVGVDIYCNDPEDVVKKYDKDDAFVLLFADGSDEDKIKSFNLMNKIEKAKYMMVAEPEGDFGALLKDTIDDLDTSSYLIKSDSKPYILCTNYSPASELKKWNKELLPTDVKVKEEKVLKSKVEKLDFDGFNTTGDLMDAIYKALDEARSKGEFGYWNYDEVIEFVWFEQVMEDYVIAGAGIMYKIPMKVENKKVILDLKNKVEVNPRLVYLEEDEEVKIVRSDAGSEPTDTSVEKNKGSDTNAENKSNVIEFERDKSLFKRELKILKNSTVAKEDNLDYHYVLGVVLEPNDGEDGPLDPDSQNEIYGSVDIQKAAHQWMTNYLNIGIMHESMAGQAILPCESYLVPFDGEINGEEIRKGSWVVGAIIEDDDIWKMVKNQEFTGWSVGGWAERIAIE